MLCIDMYNIYMMYKVDDYIYTLVDMLCIDM